MELAVGGALLGTACNELAVAVKYAISKISSFQPALKRIESTLVAITPRLDAITRLDQQLDRSGSGIDDLIILVRDGKELVVECSNIHNLDYVKKIQYSTLLLELDNKLLRYIMTVLTLDQSMDTKEILVGVNHLLKHCKLSPTSNDSESSDKHSDEPSGVIMQMEECIKVYEDNENIRKELGITVENEESEQFFEKDSVNVKLGEDMVEMQDEAEGSSSLQALQQETFELLLDQLVGRGHQRRKVISICGIGGIGKTTLAQKLYTHVHVKCHFDAFAWVSVSQTSQTREILDSVLVRLSTSSTTKKISEMSDDEVAKELNFVQQKKKCLVILDDIWREDDWNALKHAFPIEKIVGVILLTTCNTSLGLQVDPNCHIHECQPLSKVESWKLFRQEAFRGRHDYQVSTNMEDLGREMVKECSGLPLAVVSIGKLLSGKHSFKEWSLVREALGMSEMATGEEDLGVFDDDVKLLETQLLSSELRRSVISTVGMGGLGKTSLARKLYNTYKDRFQLHAWVCLSQEWNSKDLLARIIKSLRTPTYDEELQMLEKMTAHNMKRHLHKLLRDKQYLVVIDDIWDEKAWDCLISALPDNLNRSRVIITTRKYSVAKLSGERTYVHKLERLREDESWELFCKKAFPKQNSVCPEDLEKIGKEMVAKCEGLPLAILVLGGLLSRKESYEWHVIKQHIWNPLIDNFFYISTLLDLSYDDLPRDLKSCFLYLGIFPKDYEINSEKLIQLWIAEDLIPQSEGRDLEELAESYIKELNARSLIHLSKDEYGLTSTCRVHDLLRDLAVKKAKELDFFHIYEESMNPSIKPFSTIRIAFRSGFERYMANYHSLTQVHTLSFLNYHRCLDDGDVTKLLTLINTSLKSLRVLDLEGVKIETTKSKLKLLEAMRKLVHLRYNRLPKSIVNLRA